MSYYIKCEKFQLKCDLILENSVDNWSISKNPGILEEDSYKVLYL